MRALRLLHRDMSNLSTLGRRTRRPAWTHLPHQTSARRRRTYARHTTAPRPLLDLPQLRKHVSQRRAVWAAHRHRTQIGGRQSRASNDRARSALVAQRRVDLTLLCTSHEAWPSCTRITAGPAQSQSAAYATRRRVAQGTARAQSAHARRLCAAGHAAQHQHGHCPRARCLRF